MATANRRMVFHNFNGHRQLRIDDADDLAAIHRLRPARWAATSAPREAFRCDAAVLAQLDTDDSGRIRTQHLRAGHLWLTARLADLSGVTAASDTLVLDHLAPDGPDTAMLRAAAEHVLTAVGAADRTRLDLATLREHRRSFAAGHPNGDGVVVGAQIRSADPEAAILADAVVAITGGSDDASSARGADAKTLDQFLDGAGEWLSWRADGRSAAVLTLGDDTPAAVDAIEAVEAAIDRWFALGDVVRFDPSSAEKLAPKIGDPGALETASADDIGARLAQEGIAPPAADGVLLLDGPDARINPAWRAKIDALRDNLLARVGTRAIARANGWASNEDADALDRDAWRRAKAAVAPFRAWRDREPAGGYARCGEDRLEGWREGPVARRLAEAIDRDDDIADELRHFGDLDKLILYQRWLLPIANNFVNFSRLYDPDEHALFELGRLVLDGRELAFTVPVTDRTAHRRIAETSRMFLVYVEITSRDRGGEHFQLAAAVTSGERGGIDIGKRGVFFDREQREWDARVVDLVANPIGLREALLAPFQAARDAIVARVQKMAESMSGRLEKVADDGVTAVEKQAKAAAEAEKGTSKLRDNLIGGSVALAALGSSFAFIVETLAGIGLWPTIAALGGLFGSVVLASAAIGIARLSKRDMAPLLEACGWAINGRMKLTRHLGRLFTQRPRLPLGGRPTADQIVGYAKKVSARTATE